MKNRSTLQLRDALGLVAVASSLALLGSETGTHFPPLETALSGTCTGVFLFLLPVDRPSRRFLLGAVFLACLCLSGRWDDSPTRAAIWAVGWAVPSFLLPRSHPSRHLLGIASTAAALAALLRTALGHSAWLPWAQEEFSLRGSGIVSGWTGSGLTGGPSATALDLALTFAATAAAACSRCRKPGRWSWRLPCLILLCWGIGTAILPLLTAARPPEWFFTSQGHRHGSVDPARDWFQSLALLLPLLGTALLMGFRNLSFSNHAGKRPGFLALPMILSGLILVSPFGGSRDLSRGSPPRVLLLKDDSLDLQVPRPGSHPLNRVGMFGLLPRYLEATGFRVEVHDEFPSLGDLQGAGILVVINPTRRASDPQLAGLREFVARGGGLLVLGDHTDLLGIQKPLNAIVGPFGIRFRFDSARPARPGWDWSLAWNPHPLTADLDRSNRILRVGTGASLEVRPPARSLIRGRYAFSDLGDRGNTGRGAFLGDYRWTAGERIGDVTLVAAARSGSGKVVVFGDTSSFQNIALPFSYPFVARLFRWLALPERSSGTAERREEAGSWLLLASLLLILWKPPAPGVLLGAGLLVAVQGGIRNQEAGRTIRTGIQRTSHPVAVVDSGHLNGHALDLWGEESIGGLVMNLARWGFLPIVTDRACGSILPEETLRVLIEPRKPIRRGETELLLGAVPSGLHLLLSLGPGGAESVRGILAPSGISLRRIPLGPVPIRPDQSPEEFARSRKEPQFSDAWALGFRGERDVRVHYRAWEIPVAATRRLGKGAVTVIADPNFLLDRTLEAENDFWEGNVRLLRTILDPGEAGSGPPGTEARGSSVKVSR